jgi:hypothetical protein
MLAEQNRAGADVFVGMNPIKEGAYNRTKQSLKEIRHAYLDIDRDGDQAIEVICTSLDIPTPNFVLNTSPGKYQVVWRMEGTNLPEAEMLLHNMANHFGSDFAATDAARVLRLPGFANRKLAVEFVVQVVQATDQIYSLRDFNIPQDSPEAPRNVRDSARSHSALGHRSQSERDWAYAMRALSRGDNPDSVIQRIAWTLTHRRAGVPDFRIYDLRSTCATRLSAGGVADEWVTQLLRQGDAQVFKKYSQMKLQMQREALTKMNRRANEMSEFATAPVPELANSGTVLQKSNKKVQ